MMSDEGFNEWYDKLKEYGEQHYAGICIECIRIDIGQTSESLCRMFGIDPKYYRHNVVLSKDFNELDINVVFKLFYFTKVLSENNYIEKWTRDRSKKASEICNKAIEDYMNRLDDRDYFQSKNRERKPIDNNN
ncbi:MAG: hypothetical protein IKX00_04035 [Bacilli bacterium]|nr:hypothetical protein [Bacilli bacterium]